MQFMWNDPRLGSRLLFLAQTKNQMVPAYPWLEMKKAQVSFGAIWVITTPEM